MTRHAIRLLLREIAEAIHRPRPPLTLHAPDCQPLISKSEQNTVEDCKLLAKTTTEWSFRPIIFS